jgi:hypothetical protein
MSQKSFADGDVCECGHPKDLHLNKFGCLVLKPKNNILTCECKQFRLKRQENKE